MPLIVTSTQTWHKSTVNILSVKLAILNFPHSAAKTFFPSSTSSNITSNNIEIDGVGLMQNGVVDLDVDKLEREEKQENPIDPRGLVQSILAGAWRTEHGGSGRQSPRKRFAEEVVEPASAPRDSPQHR